jgi:hypothetical protein
MIRRSASPGSWLRPVNYHRQEDDADIDEENDQHHLAADSCKRMINGKRMEGTGRE